MSVKNRKLYQRIGEYNILLQKLQESCIPYEIEITSYDEALKSFSEEPLFDQAFALENQFPPGISFTGTIDGQPELKRDFIRNKRLVYFGIAKYEANDRAKEIYRDVYDGELKDYTLPLTIGYAMGVDVSSISELKKLDIERYMSSLIVDHRFRTRGVAHEMASPILGEFDSTGKDSFLTTWCNNGIKTHHSYYPPPWFWCREGYEFLDTEYVKKIVNGIKKMHHEEGITGRNYSVKEIKIRDLDTLRHKGLDLERKIGRLEKYYESIGYGEMRWDGVVMLRKNNNLNKKNHK